MLGITMCKYILKILKSMCHFSLALSYPKPSIKKAKLDFYLRKRLLVLINPRQFDQSI